MKVGDIYTYNPTSTWCRHRIAVVYERYNKTLAACDTYWYGISGQPSDYGNYDNVDLERLISDNFIGNRDDFKKVHERDYEMYLEADRLFIPIGGGHQAYYVRTTATIDHAKAIEYLQEQIRQKRSEISSAEYSIRLLEKEIAEHQGAIS